MNAKHLILSFLMLILTLLTGNVVAATEAATGALPDFTVSTIGIICVLLFVTAYVFVIAEEVLHLRKSKPVLVAAGAIWVLVATAFMLEGDTTTAEQAVRHNILEFAELMLFLLAAMTYVNTLEERNIFKALRAWLVSSGFSLRQIFWLTGLLAFFISPIADNLTTALLMAAVVMAVGAGNVAFVSLGCVHIVIAANAGGAFSPFGDITTLMVWQKGIVDFQEFFVLFLPSLVNWLIPAIIMTFALPKGNPEPAQEVVHVKKGGYVIIGLFLMTITFAVCAHNFFHLPPVIGMMMGLGILQIYGYMLRRGELSDSDLISGPDLSSLNAEDREALLRHYRPKEKYFDIFISIKRAEWDTLLFFYGVILCVGGLGTLGYLALVSEWMYGGLGPTWANILVGILSALIDNIPVMFAVLTMMPEMSHGQWLLVTLTAGVGGSLLSIGSAAGVALMGQARGIYTFFGHLRWTWAIALGYAASIYTHLLINANLM